MRTLLTWIFLCGVALAQIPTDGLVLWQSFEDVGTLTPDRSGNNNFGTVSGSPATEDGVLGRAINFANSNQFVTVGTASSFNNFHQTGIGSVAYWFRANSIGSSFHTVVASTPAATTERGFYIGGPQLTNSTWLMTITRGSAGSPLVNVTSDSIPGIVAGRWAFVAVVFNRTAGTVTLYVNDSKYSYPATFQANAAGNATRAAVIGKSPGSGTGTFPGLIDDMLIYTTALTDQEVSAIYNTLRHKQIYEGN